MLYAGLDVHKNFVQACWINDENKVVREQKFLTTPDGIRELCNATRGSRCVMESSTACYRVYDALQETRTQVRVAHPLHVKAIAYAKVKTDAVDARTLAELEHANLIPESHLPNKNTRELRLLINEHVAITRDLTRLKNRVHALLLKQDVSVSGNVFTNKNSLIVLSRTNGAVKLALEQAFERLRFLKRQRDRVDALIEQQAVNNPDAVLLHSIPGVGWFSALLLTAFIDGVNRFPDAEHLTSYAGLAPRVKQSAEVRRSGSISKQGNPLLRWSLVQCAWITIRESKRFRKQFTKLLKRKNPNTAIIVIARKLLTCAFYMLLRRQEYKEF